jgi:hypothetical protein
MFGFCRDPLVQQLRRFGFNLVALAEESIEPLEIVGRRDGSLTRYGPINQIFESTQPVPKIDRDIEAAELKTRHSTGSSVEGG